MADKFIVAFEVEASDLKEADRIAEGISDAAEEIIKFVLPANEVFTAGGATEEDDYGQLVIYTDLMRNNDGELVPFVETEEEN